MTLEDESRFPTEEMEMTTILVVKDIEKSKNFHTNILGAELYREYGETSIVYKFQGVLPLIVTGGESTAGKPNIIFKDPENYNTPK